MDSLDAAPIDLKKPVNSFFVLEHYAEDGELSKVYFTRMVRSRPSSFILITSSAR
jgi:hypothetical protein